MVRVELILVTLKGDGTGGIEGEKKKKKKEMRGVEEKATYDECYFEIRENQGQECTSVGVEGTDEAVDDVFWCVKMEN